jgi:hypothetical protein
MTARKDVATACKQSPPHTHTHHTHTHTNRSTGPALTPLLPAAILAGASAGAATAAWTVTARLKGVFCDQIAILSVRWSSSTTWGAE